MNTQRHIIFGLLLGFVLFAGSQTISAQARGLFNNANSTDSSNGGAINPRLLIKGTYSEVDAPGYGVRGPKLRVAVLNLSGGGLRTQSGYPPNYSTIEPQFPSGGQLMAPTEISGGLTEMLTTELVRTGKFVVLERAALQQVTAEQDFAATERINRETAAARNLITGAQALVIGDITEFCYERSSVGGGFNLAGFGAKVGRSAATVALHIRVIDVVTGEVIFSERFKGSSNSTSVSGDVPPVASFAAKTGKPLARASQKAIVRAVMAIASSLDKIEWIGRVVDVRGKDVYVNAGSESGIRIGMKFEAYERQEALVDPETGRNLGAPERRIGDIDIIAVEDKYSIAKSTVAESIKRGHVVRPVQRFAKSISD